MKAVWNGVTLAETDEVVFLEGNAYFPPESLRKAHFAESRMRSICPWKGIAHYYTIEAGGQRNRNAAWFYPHPFPWVRRIRDHVAFWNGVEVRPGSGES